jgi:beta-lactamase regulating signal transducer with metallopeptidase domain/HEAT repeat protein
MNGAEWLMLDRVGFQTAWVLLSALWQSSILLAAAGLLAYALRARRSSVRHAILAAAILASPLIPLLGWAVSRSGTPQAPIPVMPTYSAAARPAQAAPPVALTPEAVTAPPVLAQAPAAPEIDQAPAAQPEKAQPREKPFSLLDYPWALALLTYAGGAMSLLCLVAVGKYRIARWARRGRAVTDPRVLGIFRAAGGRLPLNRDVALVESRRILSPMTVGTLHPVILLPAGLAQDSSDEDLLAIALHELNHVRRCDSLLLTLLSLVRAVLFFHPLVWLGCRQASNLAEGACDDAVLDATGEPVSYAKMLARLAERLPRHALGTELAVGIVLSNNAFLRRIQAILSDRRDRFRRLSRLAMLVTVSAAALSVVIALALPLGEKNGGESASQPATRPSTQPTTVKLNDLPDYVQILNEEYGRGVTNQNNAAILMFEVFGRDFASDQLWAQFQKKLGITPPPPLPPATPGAPHNPGEGRLNQYFRDPQNEYDAARKGAWNAKDLPAVAQWLKDNEKPLDLLTEASRRPRFYLPVMDVSPMVYGQIVSLGMIRQADTMLVMRANMAAGESRWSDAWSDILAVQRMGRLLGQDPNCLSRLVGFGTCQAADAATQRLATSGKLDAGTLRNMLKDLIALGPPPTVASSMESERYAYLDAIRVMSQRPEIIEPFFEAMNPPAALIASPPAASAPAASAPPASEAAPSSPTTNAPTGSQPVGTVAASSATSAPAESATEPAQEEWPLKRAGRLLTSYAGRVDWRIVAQTMDRFWDIQEAAMRAPDIAWQARMAGEVGAMKAAMQEQAKDEPGPSSTDEEITKWATGVILSIPSNLMRAQQLSDAAATRYNLSKLALALAIVRDEKGAYPPSLADLSPVPLKTVPTDFFAAGKPLIYKLQDDGYLLYSIGINRTDDGGRDDKNNDDIFVRAGSNIPTSAGTRTDAPTSAPSAPSTGSGQAGSGLSTQPATQAADGGWGNPGTNGLRIRLMLASRGESRPILTPDQVAASLEVWNTGDKPIKIAEQNTTGGREMIVDEWLIGLKIQALDASHGGRTFFRADNEGEYWASVEKINGGARDIPPGGKAMFKVRLHRLVDREGTNLLSLRGDYELRPVLEILGYGGNLWRGSAVGNPVSVQIYASTATGPATPTTSAPATHPADGGGAEPGKATITKVYDVRDLIFPIESCEPPPVWAPAQKAPPDAPVESAQTAPAEVGLTQELVKTLQEQVDPESWQGPGAVGKMRELHGMLVVTQTPKNQERLGIILQQLREGRSLQVRVKGQFIVMSSKQDQAMRKWLAENVKGEQLDEKTGAMVLNVNQAGAMYEKAYPNLDVHVLAAPWLTIFNGKRACVSVATEQALGVSLLDKEGKVDVKFLEGAVQDIQPTVSADRKHVNLTVRPIFSKLLSKDALPRFSQALTDLTISLPDKGTLLVRLPFAQRKVRGAVEKVSEKGAKTIEMASAPADANATPQEYLYFLVEPTIIEQREVEENNAFSDGPASQPATRPAPSTPSTGSGLSTQPAAEAAEIDRLIKQLGSEKFAEREAAQQALVKIGLPALATLELAAQSADAERAARAKVVVQAIEEQVIAAASAQWGNLAQGPVSPSELARRRSVMAALEKGLLRDTSDAARLKVMVDAATAEPASDVRRAMIRRAGRLAMGVQEDFLLDRLKNDPDFFMRQNAASGLGEIGLEATADALIAAAQSDRSTPGLMGDVGSSAGTCRRAAVFALAELAERHGKIAPRIVLVLRDLPLTYDPKDNEHLYDARLQALYQITGEATLLEPFYQRLKSPDARERESGVIAFRFLKLRKAPAELVERLRDQDGQVQSWAALVLGEIGDLVAAEGLIGVATDAKANIYARVNAVASLGQLRAQAAVPALEGLIEVREGNIGDHAKSALELIRSSATTPSTQPVTSTPSTPSTSSGQAGPGPSTQPKTAVRVPFPEADNESETLDVKRLLDRVVSWNEMDGIQAREQLVAMGSSGVPAILIGLKKSANADPRILYPQRVQDFDWRLRAAMYALAAIGDRRAIPAISTLTQYEVPKASRASEALELILAQGSPEQLQADAKSDMPPVAKAAARLLGNPDELRKLRADANQMRKATGGIPQPGTLTARPGGFSAQPPAPSAPSTSSGLSTQPAAE